MKGLLVVTMLMMAVLVVLPPAGSSDVYLSNNSQAAGPGVLTSIALLFTSLRDLLYAVGETAIKISSGLWEVLPERLKPLVGLLVLGVSSLAFLGALTLSGVTRMWRRISG
jgi:hypothetical protein